jgi:hypothetical protein
MGFVNDESALRRVFVHGATGSGRHIGVVQVEIILMKIVISITTIRSRVRFLVYFVCVCVCVYVRACMNLCVLYFIMCVRVLLVHGAQGSGRHIGVIQVQNSQKCFTQY